MKKAFLIIILLFALTITGCVKSPNVKWKETIGGEEVVVLKEKESDTSSTEARNLLSIHEITRIGEVMDAFYLSNYSILLLRERELQELSLDKYYLISRIETELIKWAKGNYFHLSPDRSKLMYIVSGEEEDPEIHILNVRKLAEGIREDSVMVTLPQKYLRTVDINWMNKKNEILFMSLDWADKDTIIFSDRDGNIYYRNITKRTASQMVELDQWFKLHLTKVGERILFIKNPGYKNLDLDINEPDYDNFIEKQKNNYLAYTIKDNMIDPIIERKSNLHIKNYQLSPDYQKIALYFEDNDNNGLLAIAHVEEDLFTHDIKYNDLIHISNELVNDFKWSADSYFLAYTTSGQMPGLYIASSTGYFNKQIVTNKNFTKVEWRPDGKGLLALEKEIDANILYEINITYEKRPERGATLVE